MPAKEYKELSCRYVGRDCDFLVRAETEEEVLNLVREHFCRDHNICEITLKDMRGHMHTVWCDPRCHDISGMDKGGGFYWG